MSPEYASASLLGMQFVPCGKITSQQHEYNVYADSIPSTAEEGARLITAPAAYLPTGGILCYPSVNGASQLPGGGYELNLEQAASLWNRTLVVTPQNCLLANGFSPVNRSHSQHHFMQDNLWSPQQQTQAQNQLGLSSKLSFASSDEVNFKISTSSSRKSIYIFYSFSWPT